MQLLIFTTLLLVFKLAYAIGDSPATSEGFLYLFSGLVFFMVAVIAVIIYVCFKVVGKSLRLRWLMIGGLPSIILLIFIDWKIALLFAFATAFYLQHKAELKQRKIDNNNTDTTNTNANTNDKGNGQ